MINLIKNQRINWKKSGNKIRIFLIKPEKGKGLKILTPKQMLQRLPIARAQVKAGNTLENLLNEIRKVIYHILFLSSKIYY